MQKPTKRVLIITYYWPPAGGSGVQRWVKFVKYLREFGWEPIIYTPSNPEFPEIDYSLESEIPHDLTILKQPIWEPYSFYKKFVGINKDSRLKTGIVQEKKNNSLAHKISVWIRGNFFIPDARKFWIQPSVNFLTGYLSRNQIDAIVTNGTPHSLHLIGLGLKERFNIPWLADFRDPWTNIDFFDDLLLTPWADKRHRALEKQVLKTANCVTVTTPGTRDDFLNICPEANVHSVTNGFDTSDFEEIDVEPDEKFVLAHIGVLTPSRNRPFFWKLLKELTEEIPEFAHHFRLRLIGGVDVSIIQELEKLELNSLVEVKDYIPHKEIIKELKKARLLLLMIRDAQNQDTIIPGKVFEYVASGRPVISIGPRMSDSAKILNLAKVGSTFSEQEKDELKTEIIRQFQLFLQNTPPGIEATNIDQFSRHSLTGKMAQLLDSIKS